MPRKPANATRAHKFANKTLRLTTRRPTSYCVASRPARGAFAPRQRDAWALAREHFGAAKQLVVPPGASIDSMRQAHVQAALAHVLRRRRRRFIPRVWRARGTHDQLLVVAHARSSMARLRFVPSAYLQDRRDGGRKAKPRTWRKGDYTVEMPIVRSNVRLHVGWFNSSLRSFSRNARRILAATARRLLPHGCRPLRLDLRRARLHRRPSACCARAA